MDRCLRALSMITALLVLGCSSISAIREVPLNEGELLTFPVGSELVRQAARDALRDAHFEIVEEQQLNEKTFSIIGLLPWAMQSHGQWARLIIEKINEGQTALHLLTKRRVAMNVTEDIVITWRAIKLYLTDRVEVLAEDQSQRAPRAPSNP